MMTKYWEEKYKRWVYGPRYTITKDTYAFYKPRWTDQYCHLKRGQTYLQFLWWIDAGKAMDGIFEVSLGGPGFPILETIKDNGGNLRLMESFLIASI